MITYIKKLVQGSLKKGAEDMFLVLRELATELYRFDPRDFNPDVQDKFVLARGRIKRLHDRGTYKGSEASEALNELLPLLDGYLGDQIRAAPHKLSFVLGAFWSPFCSIFSPIRRP
jgi:hypothetical protein